MNKSIVELNGKKYDATSGKLLNDIKPSADRPVAKPTEQGSHKSEKPKPAARQHTPNQQARKAQSAKTLMRDAVKKPDLKDNKPIKSVATPADSSSQLRRPSLVREKRVLTASKASVNPLISRFGQSDTTRVPVNKRTEHVPVAAAPDIAPPAPKAAIKPKPAAASNPADHHIKKAMESAESHTKHKLKKTKAHHKAAHKMGVTPKFLSGAAATLAFVLLAGFFAYQNVPNIAVRLAANKAGFDAKLPGYRPSGFAMTGPVQAGPGVVTVNFASNSDERSYQVSQRPSEWNSESLLSRFVEEQNSSYQTLQEAGRTIYLYDEASATWVDGGVWYQIDGNSNLSADQLVRIATSL